MLVILQGVAAASEMQQICTEGKPSQQNQSVMLLNCCRVVPENAQVGEEIKRFAQWPQVRVVCACNTLMLILPVQQQLYCRQGDNLLVNHI